MKNMILGLLPYLITLVCLGTPVVLLWFVLRFVSGYWWKRWGQKRWARKRRARKRQELIKQIKSGYGKSFEALHRLNLKVFNNTPSDLRANQMGRLSKNQFLAHRRHLIEQMVIRLGMCLVLVLGAVVLWVAKAENIFDLAIILVITFSLAWITVFNPLSATYREFRRDRRTHEVLHTSGVVTKWNEEHRGGPGGGAYTTQHLSVAEMKFRINYRQYAAVLNGEVYSVYYLADSVSSKIFALEVELDGSSTVKNPVSN